VDSSRKSLSLRATDGLFRFRDHGSRSDFPYSRDMEIIQERGKGGGIKMSVDAGSPLAREWAREEIKKLQRADLAELEADEALSVCPFPKGERAGIRCQKIIMAERKAGGWMRICPVPSGECVYHG